MLDWDAVHVSYCVGKKLYPGRIAERIGATTDEVYKEISDLKERLSQLGLL